MVERIGVRQIFDCIDVVVAEGTLVVMYLLYLLGVHDCKAYLLFNYLYSSPVVLIAPGLSKD